MRKNDNVPVGRASTLEQKRIVLEALMDLWSQVPNLRLGQLIVNACGKDPYYMEDFDMIEHIRYMVVGHED